MINATFVINGVIAAISALLMVNTYNLAKADFGSRHLMRCISDTGAGRRAPDGGMGKILDADIRRDHSDYRLVREHVPELNTYYSSLISPRCFSSR